MKNDQLIIENGAGPYGRETWTVIVRYQPDTEHFPN
jgi:hypothetical protein